MKTIFLSWYDGFLEKTGKQLYSFLETSEVNIITSPYSPHCGKGNDEKWENWYDNGLPEAVKQSDIFIAFISKQYDSTWMAQEFQTAFNWYLEHKSPKLFVFNPEKLKLPKGFEPYIKSSVELPRDLSKLIRCIGI